MRIPLGGVDAFHLMNDRVMRARGLAGNHCLFAVSVQGRLDVHGLVHRIERAVSLLPELRRRLVWSPSGPAWREDPPGSTRGELRVRSVASTDLAAALFSLIDERTDGDRPWSATLLRTESADTFVWSWFHPLCDARSAARFVAWLGSGETEQVEPPPPEERYFAGTRPLAKLDRKARLDLTRTYGNHMLEHAKLPVVSLTSLTKTKLGATRTVRVQLTADETRAFDKRVRERAKLAETSVMVFASTRLFDAILRGRGLAPAQHLIPVPLSLDPKAGVSRMFGNNLTMMTFALRRDDLADLGRAVMVLAEQQRAIIREKLDTGMLASLEFAKVVPAGVYHWFMTRPFRGEVSSLIFSNPGAITLPVFCSRPVTDAFVLPSVTVPPGFQVIFSRYGGCLSAFIGYIDGTLEPAEERSLADSLKTELLGL